MNDKKESLENDLIKSIGQSELKDIAIDFGEIGLDTMLDDGVLKDIPVLGTLAKLYSTGATIREKIFERKLIKFLVSLDKISLEKRRRFIDELSADKDQRRKVGEHLMILLERMDNMEKPEYLAKLLAAYIDKKVDYEMFQRLSGVVDKAFISDIKKLDIYNSFQYGGWITTSLENLGLVDLRVISGGGPLDNDGKEVGGNMYGISDLGQLFLSIIQNY